MSDMKDFLRDLGYFGVGAAALVVETGAKAVNALVKKGKKTLSDNQDTVDEIKRKAKEAGQRIKDAVEKATSAPEDESSDDAPVAPDVIYHTDEPIPPEVPIPEATVTPDKKAEHVIYTDETFTVAGRIGYEVDSYKIKYVNGEEVERIHMYHDTYKAVAPVIYTGVSERPLPTVAPW